MKMSASPVKFSSTSVRPEVILDRYVRDELSRMDGYEGYVGRQKLELLEPDLRSLLVNIQQAFNEGLRRENTNVSGGVAHPPFYVDYVAADAPNALAFQYEGYAFVVMTTPLVRMLLKVCERLSVSHSIARIRGADAAHSRLEGVYATLFATQLGFLIAHEYTHHIHRHLFRAEFGSTIWNEGLDNSRAGGLDNQAKEVDADAYAVYIVLTDLITGERRPKAVAILGNGVAPDSVADENLLASFVVAVGSFFYSLPSDKFDPSAVDKGTHPPQAARMSYVMDAVRSWLAQNRPSLLAQVTPEWYQTIMRQVAESMYGASGEQDCDKQIDFLLSAPGKAYGEQLSEGLNRLLQNLP
jgi:hypothetical protein